MEFSFQLNPGVDLGNFWPKILESPIQDIVLHTQNNIYVGRGYQRFVAENKETESVEVSIEWTDGPWPLCWVCGD